MPSTNERHRRANFCWPRMGCCAKWMRQVVNDDPTREVVAWTLAAAAVLLVLGFASRAWGRPECGSRHGDAVYRPWDMALVFFLFFVFGGGALMSLSSGDATGLDAGQMASSILFLFVVAGGVVVAVTVRESPDRWLGLRWPAWRHLIWIGPSGVVLMWAVMGLLLSSGYMGWMERMGADSMQETVRVLQEESDMGLLALTAMAALVAAPLCEEVIFRGYCYPVLRKYAGGLPAALVTSLVFSCAHANLAGLAPLFLLGLMLALVYEKTRSIWGPVSIHFCFNAATVAVQFAVRWLDPQLLDQ